MNIYDVRIVATADWATILILDSAIWHEAGTVEYRINPAGTPFLPLGNVNSKISQKEVAISKPQNSVVPASVSLQVNSSSNQVKFRVRHGRNGYVELSSARDGERCDPVSNSEDSVKEFFLQLA